MGMIGGQIENSPTQRLRAHRDPVKAVALWTKKDRGISRSARCRDLTPPEIVNSLFWWVWARFFGPLAIANACTDKEFRRLELPRRPTHAHERKWKADTRLTEREVTIMVAATFVREKRVLRNFVTLIVGWRAIAGSA
jgi:hypothetical protein